MLCLSARTSITTKASHARVEVRASPCWAYVKPPLCNDDSLRAHISRSGGDGRRQVHICLFHLLFKSDERESKQNKGPTSQSDSGGGGKPNTPPFACLPPRPSRLPFHLPPAGGLPNHVFAGVLLMFHSLSVGSRGGGVIPLPKWRLLSP